MHGLLEVATYTEAVVTPCLPSTPPTDDACTKHVLSGSYFNDIWMVGAITNQHVISITDKLRSTYA